MYYHLTRLFAAFAVICFLSVSADARTWKSANNKYEFQGEFVELDGDDVVISSDDDGENISVNISKLSKPDQGFVRREVSKAKGEKRKKDADQAESDEDGESVPAKKKSKATVEGIEADLDTEIGKIENGRSKDSKKHKDVAAAKIKAGEKILKLFDESADRIAGYKLQTEGLLSLLASGDRMAEKKLRSLAEKGKADKKVTMEDKMQLTAALQAKHGSDGAETNNGSDATEETATVSDSEDKKEEPESTEAESEPAEEEPEPAVKKTDSKVKANLKKKVSRPEPEE